MRGAGDAVRALVLASEESRFNWARLVLTSQVPRPKRRCAHELHRAEIPQVQGRDRAGSQSLGDGHHAGIHETQIEVRIACPPAPAATSYR